MDTARIVGPAISSVREGETRIYPEQYENIYLNWLENIEPWCISRQLWWGHQVPVWYDDDGNEYCAVTEEEAAAQAGGRSIRRDSDVLDTWFSSGLWPIGTLGWPDSTEELARYFPTDVLVTGFDIIFFWVARMMMMQHAVVGRKPFHTVYVHALVRDKFGRKMSKSLGNVIDPIDLIDKFGADAVRFTLASMAAMGRDLRLSEDRVAGYRNFGTKLWNAARYAEMNQCRQQDGYSPERVSDRVNRWIVGEVGRTRESADAALEAFRFNDAAERLYSFVWGTVCDWYLEFSKEMLKSEDDALIAETRQTISWVLDQCLILLHPMMPFITEEIWGFGERSTMLIHQAWPGYTADQLADDRCDREIGHVIRLIEEVRSVRALMRVPAAARISLLQLELDEELQGAVTRNLELVSRLARVESLENASEAPSGSATIWIEGGSFCIPLEGIIDVGAETARLEKSLERAGKEIDQLKRRLANPGFVSNAPEMVIEETRSRLTSNENEAGTLARALERLQPAA